MTYDEAKDWISENLPDYVPPDPAADFAKVQVNFLEDLVTAESPSV